MSQRIKIFSDFDITNTGVVRNYKEGMVPCKIAGRTITTKDEWINLRRQQANWETIIQLVSLRTQPLNIRTVTNKSDWTLEFDIDFADLYRKNGDPLGLLKEDMEHVPMLTDLTETKKLDHHIIVDGNTPNVRFESYEL